MYENRLRHLEEEHHALDNPIAGPESTVQRVVNAHSQFNLHLDFESDSAVDSELDQAKLNTLEISV